jgi:hypothetical protein
MNLDLSSHPICWDWIVWLWVTVKMALLKEGRSIHGTVIKRIGIKHAVCTLNPSRS